MSDDEIIKLYEKHCGPVGDAREKILREVRAAMECGDPFDAIRRLEWTFSWVHPTPFVCALFGIDIPDSVNDDVDLKSWMAREWCEQWRAKR